MRKRQLILLPAALALWFALAPQAVLAHAAPVSFEPQPNAVSAQAPATVSIAFSERVDDAVSDIEVTGPNGSRADVGRASTKGDGRTLYVPLSDAGQGTYMVSWQIVSADDGHFTKGTFSFSVGRQSVTNAAVGQIQIQHLASLPEAATIWLEILGQALVLGTLIMLMAVGRRIAASGRDQAAFVARRSAVCVVAGASFAAVGAASFLILKSADLESLRATGLASSLWRYLTTVSGMYAAARLVIAVAVAAVFLRKKDVIVASRKPTRWEAAILALLALAALDRTRVSHAAATAFHPAFAIVVHAVHLLAKEAWVGVVAAACFLGVPAAARAGKRGSAARVLLATSGVVAAAIGAAGATGMYVIWLDLKSPANLFTTQWGTETVILLAVTAALIALRLYHMAVVDPAAAKAVRPGAEAPRSVALAPYTLAAELIVGVAFLFVTSVLIITTPPYASQEYSFHREAVSRGVRITLTVRPHEPSDLLLTLTDAATGAPVEAASLLVSAADPDAGIGATAVATTERFRGGYAFPRTALDVPGAWKLRVTVNRPGADDSVGTFDVDSPAGIDATRNDPDARSFGPFEASFASLAGLAMAFSILLCFAVARLAATAAEDAAGKHPFGTASGAAYGVTFVLCAAVLAAVWATFQFGVKSDFERRCEDNGDFWLQAVPMRNGVAVSSDTVTGCTTAVGLNHFVDRREYDYYGRDSRSVAELALSPSAPLAGQPTDMRLSLFDLVDGAKAGPAEDLTIQHDRYVHLFIIGSDLKTFGHIHTEDVGPVTPDELRAGSFPFRYVFPAGGDYTVAANWYVRGKEFVQQFPVAVTGAPELAPPELDFSRTKNFDGYDVTLSAPARVLAGAPVKLSYEFTKDGAPVKDLEPYLAAAMHIAIVNADGLQEFVHAHGQPYIPGSVAIQRFFSGYVRMHDHFVPDRFGPGIQAYVTFPRAGDYAVFGEVRRGGASIVTDFLVHAQ